MSDLLVWEVIYRHAPEEFLQDTKADPEWEWKAHPEVRAAVRPVIAEEAKTASFLMEQGIKLTTEANNLFLDAVEDNLLAAFGRLEGFGKGLLRARPCRGSVSGICLLARFTRALDVGNFSKHGLPQFSRPPAPSRVGQPCSRQLTRVFLTPRP